MSGLLQNITMMSIVEILTATAIWTTAGLSPAVNGPPMPWPPLVAYPPGLDSSFQTAHFLCMKWGKEKEN